MRLSPWTIARSPLEVQDLFFRQRQVDRFGVNLHTAAAVGACLCAGMPTTVVEWASLPLLLVFIVRMTAHHRMLRTLWVDPAALLLGLWAVLASVSIMWTAGSAKDWLGDIQSLRFGLLVLALWPVLHARRLLMISLMIGLGVGQVVQFMHAMGWTTIERAPWRLSGWWDPVIGGSLLCAQLGAFFCLGRTSGKDRYKAIGLLWGGATIVSIGATGTRGAWIGAAVTLAIIGMKDAARTANGRWWLGLILGAAVIIGVAMSSVDFLRDAPEAESRLRQGIAEVRDAIKHDKFTSDTGMRIAMAKWALAEFKARPVLGVGAGGYKAWAAEQTPERARELGAPPRVRTRLHAHAHSWYLHVLATTGLAGAAALFGATLLAIRSSWRGPADGVRASGIDAAPGMALVGLCAAGLFDSITINQQTAYVFFILFALCLPKRPRAVGEPRFDDGGAA